MESSLQCKSPILIIGAGIAGLALANALASKKIKTIILEKSNNQKDIDRGDVLHNSTVELLKKWGLEQEFQLYHPISFSLFEINTTNGRRLFSFDANHELNNPNYFTVLKHPQILTFLATSALKSGYCEILYSQNVNSLIWQKKKVIGVQTSKESFYSPITILAAGTSSVNLSEKINHKINSYSTKFYNCCFKLIPEFAHKGMYIVGKAGIMITVPLPNNELRIGLQINKEVKLSSISLKGLIKERMPNFPVDKLEFISANLYPLKRSFSKKWWLSGILLIGDAAHTVHPVGGQGMNLAFDDADKLADCLSNTNISNIKDLNQTMNVFENSRIKSLRTTIIFTNLIGKISESKSPSKQAFLQIILLILNKVYFLKMLVFKKILNH